MKLKDRGRKILCLFAGISGLMISGCTKAKYTWATEDEYFKVPIWKQHVRTFKKIKAKPHTVTLFIGDSITEGFDLNRHLDQDSLVNMGISGDFTSGVLRRLDIVKKLQPKKIFVMIGINDILKNIPPERIKSQYGEIINTLIRDCPSSKLFIQSNLPTTGMGGSESNNVTYIREILLLNAFLRETCLNRGVTFIDLYPKFEFPKDQLNADYTYDGLHLSDNGYKIWSDVIRPFVQE